MVIRPRLRCNWKGCKKKRKKVLLYCNQHKLDATKKPKLDLNEIMKDTLRELWPLRMVVPPNPFYGKRVCRPTFDVEG